MSLKMFSYLKPFFITEIIIRYLLCKKSALYSIRKK